jgi:hypothetical protein
MVMKRTSQGYMMRLTMTIVVKVIAQFTPSSSSSSAASTQPS